MPVFYYAVCFWATSRTPTGLCHIIRLWKVFSGSSLKSPWKASGYRYFKERLPQFTEAKVNPWALRGTLFSVRSSMQSLSRVIYIYDRHPFILPLTEPLVEDKVSLAFATRPVVQTLAGLIATKAALKRGPWSMKCLLTIWLMLYVSYCRIFFLIVYILTLK